MAKELQFRRGTTAQHSTFTGAEGELTVDTTKDTLVVHDGSTVGGFPLARESEVVSSSSSTPNTLVRRDLNKAISAGKGTFTDLVITDPTTDLGGELILMGHNDVHMHLSNKYGVLVIGDDDVDLFKVGGTGGIWVKGVVNTPGLELGFADAIAGTPYIDFHSGTTVTDYDSRIIADGGTSSTGGGRLMYVAHGGHTFHGQVNTSRIVATGIGNDFDTGGVELVGNGVTNTVFPTLGFYQPGLYAGSLQQRGATDFRLYAQGATAYANLTVAQLDASTLNLVGQGDTTTAATHYFVETGTDGFVRPKTLANAQAELVTFASVYNANKTWFTSGVGTAGINGATNYALFPDGQDTLTLGVGTYEIEIVADVTVATSTVSGAFQLSPRGAGTAIGIVYGMGSGAIIGGGTPIQAVVGVTSLGTALTVTAASAVAGRVYNVQFKGIMNITTAGTIIPAYQFSATLTSGVVTFRALNHMKIKQIASTSVTTAGGWV